MLKTYSSRRRSSHPPTPARYLATAIHEAGHAVAAVVLKLGLGEVSVNPQKMESDEVGYAIVSNPIQDWTRGDGSRRSLFENYAVSLYAGREAERFVLGTETIGHDGDYSKVEFWLQSMGVSGASFVGDEVWEGYKDRLRRRATKLIRNYGPAVRQFADLLVSRDTISGSEALTILRHLTETPHHD